MKHIITFLLLLVPLAAMPQMETVRNSVRADYLKTVPCQNVALWNQEMREDGTWPDIDYADQSRSLWQLEYHLDRLIDMSLVFEQTGRKDKNMLRHIILGLNHWFSTGYHNENWWYTKIGVPRRMLAIAYILDNDLPQPLRQAISKSLDMIDSSDHLARPGGDRIQVLTNHAKVMLWRRDTEGAVQLFQKIEDEARVAPFEEVMHDAVGGLAVRNGYRPAGRGVQADMTFHHRGDRVNSTITYGLELPEYYAYWAEILQNTPWQFSETHTRFVVDFYLDAVCRHLVRGRYYEPSAFNRELARPGSGTMSSKLARRLLSICNGYRIDQLRHYIRVQDGEESFSDSYAHLFWQSDYFVFSRPGFQTAVRLHSVRNANQEAPHNSEGIRNHFRGDGACMLSVTGKEYSNLWPVFDFRMIPGATTSLFPYHPLQQWGDVQLFDVASRYAGAVCDSLYGAVAFDFKSGRNDLQARKSWFFFDQGYICLGSDIACTSGDTILTTIEQCRQLSGVTRQDHWYFHAGNAYYIIDGDATSSTTYRHGSWANCVASVAHAADTLSAPVFSLALIHGVRPHGATYAYAVCPNVSSPQEPWFSILQNGEGIQAVERLDGRLIYAVFYHAGSLKTSAGNIEVDAPCMIMVRDTQLYVSDPSRQHYRLTVTTSSGRREVALPTHLLAGTTVKVGQI